MNTKDFALLKREQILDEIQERSGATLAEIEQQYQDSMFATLRRMDERGVLLPIPTVRTQRLESTPIGASYRCRRPLPGKGINQQAWVGLQVITSIRLEDDDRLWLHVSFTRLDGKMPTYDDLVWVKDAFIGGLHWAFQYFPPKSEHVSDHNKCLHLWSCLEKIDLPDFRKFGSI